MASTSIDVEKIMWEAASNTCMAEKPCWERLDMFLTMRNVDVSERSMTAWMDAYEKKRQIVLSIKQQTPPNSVSFAASDDGFNNLIHIATKTHPDGMAPAGVIYSDEGDYILETIRQKCGLSIGADGLVDLIYFPNPDEKKTVQRKCKVRPDDEGEADVVFRTRTTGKGKAGIISSEINGDEYSSTRDIRQTIEATEQLQSQIETDEVVDKNLPDGVHMVLGLAFQPRASNIKSDEEFANLGRGIAIAMKNAFVGQNISSSKQMKWPQASNLPGPS